MSAAAGPPPPNQPPNNPHNHPPGTTGYGAKLRKCFYCPIPGCGYACESRDHMYRHLRSKKHGHRHTPSQITQVIAGTLYPDSRLKGGKYCSSNNLTDKRKVAAAAAATAAGGPVEEREKDVDGDFEYDDEEYSDEDGEYETDEEYQEGVHQMDHPLASNQQEQHPPLLQQQQSYPRLHPPPRPFPQEQVAAPAEPLPSQRQRQLRNIAETASSQGFDLTPQQQQQFLQAGYTGASSGVSFEDIWALSDQLEEDEDADLSI